MAIFLVAQATISIWLRVGRLRARAPGPATPQELQRELAWGLALLVVTLAGFATFDRPVSSPPGGPTMIVMEVPCALSSPRTCSS